MPNISELVVPRRAQPSLRWLAELEDDASDRLAEALTTGAPYRSLKMLKERVAELTGFDNAQIDDFLDTALNLMSLHNSHGWQIADVAQTLAESDDLAISPERRDAFKTRLVAALSAHPVVGLAKAFDVTYEVDRVFHLARVMTDIRPVFGDDPSSGVLGAVVVHTLRLDHYANGKMETFSVALTDSDLAELDAAITRAQQKRVGVDRVIASASLTGYSVQDSDG